MAAHELKTPITSLKGFAQLFQRGMHAERAAQVIIEQVNHLDELVGDLLDVARLESGHVRLNPSPTDLVEVVRRSVEQAQALSLNHQMELQAPDRPVLGSWDGHRLEQVITNLLSNAVKYAPDCDRVDVEVQEAESEVRVVVTDYGPGIPPRCAATVVSSLLSGKRSDPSGRGRHGPGPLRLPAPGRGARRSN